MVGQVSYSGALLASNMLSSLEQNLSILAANSLCLEQLLNKCKKESQVDIEIGSLSKHQKRGHIDNPFFIFRGPRRSSLDSIDREKFIVSRKVVGMWGIGKKIYVQDSEDFMGKPSPVALPKPILNKEGNPAPRRHNEKSGVECCHGGSHFGGIVKTVSVEVVDVVVSELDKTKGNRSSSPESSIQTDTSEISVFQGVKNLTELILQNHFRRTRSTKDSGELQNAIREKEGEQEGRQNWETILRGGSL